MQRRVKLSLQLVKPPVDVEDNAGNVVLTLDKVDMYKYLGTWTYGSMYKTAVEKQKLCVKTAYKYKSSCIHVSRMGPDVVDVALCTWSNVAIPAILTGCEMIPFCATRIAEIERVQAQVAKFVLGISSTCPNVCAQTELGLKPFKQLLFERQLKFYFRALFINKDRWVHQALLDHLSGDWISPYMQHIADIRGKMNLFEAVPAPSSLKPLVGEYFLEQINLSISSFRWIQPLESLNRAGYVCENENSPVIAEFKLDRARLGDKEPRQGYTRKPFCPACPFNVPNNGIHLLFTCSSISALRAECGIQSFITQCTLKGLSLEECYRNFVNGLDSNNNSITKQAYIERGKCMKNMRELWYTKW